MGDEFEYRKGRYNSGASSVERIHSLLSGINIARQNPLAMNAETGTMNFQVMVTCNDGLVDEAWGKLTEPERKIVTKIHELNKMALKIFPPISKINGDWVVNQENYEKLMDIIDKYCQINRDFLDAHNLGNPDEWDDEGL
jgi:hypothetical protein